MRGATAQLTELMTEAVAHSLSHVEAGGLPFVGVVVGSDHVSGFGVNRVGETGDPSAHAEIVAMRATLDDLGVADLGGRFLLATGEPCGLCYRFAVEQRIEKVYVAVDSDTVAEWGFDYRRSYRDLGVDRVRINGFATPLPVPNGLEPFKSYLHINQSNRPPSPSERQTRKGSA